MASFRPIQWQSCRLANDAPDWRNLEIYRLVESLIMLDKFNF